MKYALASLVAALAGLALSSCETQEQYDGVSRFADTGAAAPYYGSLPRDAGDGDGDG